MVTLAAPHGGRPASMLLGRHLAGHTITVLRDGDHITVYTPDGDVLGHQHLDPTKRYQGRLTPAA
ncbi:hypothetical protein Acsp06_22780 [Actinomycetospora sp. NBRC 106375]|nr:hypothetical protein Acsp06_22780 [Actinomycetospora sp. NBRC 106375]